MFRAKLLFALLLVQALVQACTPQSNPQTACGVWLEGPGVDKRLADTIGPISEHLLATFKRCPDGPPEWRIQMKANYYWVDPIGREVAGLTWCPERRMDVGRPDLVVGESARDTWSRSTLSHEWAHSVRCGREKGDHSDWDQIEPETGRRVWDSVGLGREFPLLESGDAFTAPKLK